MISQLYLGITALTSLSFMTFTCKTPMWFHYVSLFAPSSPYILTWIYEIISSFYFSCVDFCICDTLIENHSCLGMRLEISAWAHSKVWGLGFFWRPFVFPQNLLISGTHIMEYSCHPKAAFHKVLTISALSVLLHHSHDSSRAKKEQFDFSG